MNIGLTVLAVGLAFFIIIIFAPVISAVAEWWWDLLDKWMGR